MELSQGKLMDSKTPDCPKCGSHEVLEINGTVKGDMGVRNYFCKDCDHGWK